MNRQTSLRSKGRELRALAALAFAVGLIAVAASVCGCGSQSSSRFGYYRDGNLKSYADAKGQRTTYEYDLLDQVTSVAYPGRERVGYSYDANGNVVGIDASSDSGYTYAYDPSDRVTKAVRPDGKALSYAYDPVGNLETLTYPDGSQVEYAYDANSWLTKVVREGRSVEYKRDRLGGIAKIVLPDGVTVDQDHAGNGQLTKSDYLKPDGTPLMSLSYELDALGNVVERTRDIGSGREVTAYRYDALSRLVAVDYPDGKKATYSYDGTGNRLSEEVDGKATDYTYDGFGLLTKAGDETFRYDRSGNLIQRRADGKTTRYFFDGRNQLTRITGPEGLKIEYTYDVLGRRTGKTTSRGTVHYVYDGDNLIQELDDRGQPLATYVYGLGVDHPVSMRRGGQTYHYLYDRLGSVVGLVDERGEAAATYEYDAWGNPVGGTGSVDNPFRFTSREWDADTGLYFYRARYYDPDVGRFISKDPFPGDPTDPQSLNGYAYVRNNPVNLVDAYGLSAPPGNPNSLPHWSDIRGWKQYYLNRAVDPRVGPYWLRVTLGTMLGMSWDYLYGAFMSAQTFGQNMAPGGSKAAAAWALADMVFWVAGPYVPSKVLVGFQTKIVSGLSIPAAAGMAAGGLAVVREPVIWTPIFRRSYWDVADKGFGLARDTRVLLEEAGKYFFPPPAAQPLPQAADVGGVLLDKAADVDIDLDEITGAYYDEQQGQLVLTGRVKGTSEERRVPRMNKDDLAVAIRAIYSGEAPGVSIDPPKSYLASGVTPPDGTAMPTRYLGDTENTHFGSVMFEADKLLKNLSMGRDNVTGKKVGSEVAGFHNELDLSMKLGGGAPVTWSRFWFMVEDMRLDLNAKETGDRSSLTFGKASMRVKTEYVGSQGSDPVAETFARHFTLHYDGFAREYPVLERLRELAKIVSIVKWLKESNKPIDLSFVDSFQPSLVRTPKSTPGIRVSKSRSWTDGSAGGTQTYSIFGGVSFDFPFKAQRDGGGAQALRDAAQTARPFKTATDWGFTVDGEPQRAVAINLFDAGERSSVVRQTDFSKDSGSGLTLELRRNFDLSNIQPSVFGFGWEPESPVKLLVLDATSSIFLLDTANGRSSTYTWVEGKKAYCLVTKERGLEYEYDPTTTIRVELGGGFTWESDQGVVDTFDSQGRLTSMADGSSRIEYAYRDGRIAGISGADGSLQFTYDDKGRVSTVDAPGGERIDYSYDAAGDLARVATSSGPIADYAYDGKHRLVEIKDGNGKVTRLGPPTTAEKSTLAPPTTAKKPADVVTDAQGNKIHRSFDDQGRLTKETDALGNSFSYEYNAGNQLAAVESSGGQVWRLGYDGEGRATDLVDPLGQEVKLGYDGQGNLSRLVDPRGESTDLVFTSANRLSEVTQSTTGRVAAFDYDAAGRVLAAVDARGSRTSFSYGGGGGGGRTVFVRDALGYQSTLRFDRSNRLVGQTNPAGFSTTFGYDAKGNLSSLRNPDGVNKYDYDDSGSPVRMVDAAGNETRFEYGENDRLLKVIDALGGVTQYTYDVRGNLTVITDANGMMTNFAYDKQGRLTAVGAKAARPTR